MSTLGPKRLDQRRVLSRPWLCSRPVRLAHRVKEVEFFRLEPTTELSRRRQSTESTTPSSTDGQPANQQTSGFGARSFFPLRYQTG
jgi:hypothetical protein